MPRSYHSDGITVHFEPALCIHTGICSRTLPDVFRPQERPWVHPEQAGAEQIADVIRRCPSGALWFERRDGGAKEAPEYPATATLRPRGPLYIRGEITLEMEDGSIRRMTRLALCRCGASGNKPFCDNSHRTAGFNGAGNVEGSSRVMEEIDATRPLHLRLEPNGPVTFMGAVEVRSVTGAVVHRSAGGEFCRCGGSADRPFCDGTHTAGGFGSGTGDDALGESNVSE